MRRSGGSLDKIADRSVTARNCGTTADRDFAGRRTAVLLLVRIGAPQSNTTRERRSATVRCSERTDRQRSRTHGPDLCTVDIE